MSRARSRFIFNGCSTAAAGSPTVPGAATNTLVLNAAVTNTGTYELVVTNSFGAATSAPIALTVTHDTTPPIVLRVANIGTTNLEVDFSKVLGPASATNVANFALTNDTAISGASLSANNSTVILTTAPLVFGSNYTLVVNGVLDQAIPPNSIATNTPVSFTASPYTSQDIGGPAIASTDVCHDQRRHHQQRRQLHRRHQRPVQL